jgi:hypothetical protein
MIHLLKNLSVLVVKPQTIRPGIVQSALKGNRWRVTSGKLVVTATSSEILVPKQRVTIGKSTEGWTVLGSGKFSNPAVTRVKIRG